MDIFSNETVGLVFSLWAAVGFACLITLVLYVGCGPVQSQRQSRVQATSYSPLPPQPPGAYGHRELVSNVEAGTGPIAPDSRPVSDPWITVPETELPGGIVEPSFQVGRYQCSKGLDGRANIDGSLAPWVRLNYAEARAACSAAGINLITERQALALTINIAGVAENWTGGAVGHGDLRQSLRKRTVPGVQPGDFVPDDVEEYGFTLSNGHRIHGVAGNAWVLDNMHLIERKP